MKSDRQEHLSLRQKYLIKASQKIRKDSMKKHSFGEMFLKRLAVTLLAAIVITTGISVWYYQNIFDIEYAPLAPQYYVELTEWAQSRSSYEEGGSKYLDLEGQSTEDQWIESLGHFETVFTTICRNLSEIYDEKTGTYTGEFEHHSDCAYTGYWCVYDRTNDTILKEVGDNVYICLCFNFGSDKYPDIQSRYFRICSSQYDELPVPNTLYRAEYFGRAPFIKTGYIDGTTIYVETYWDDDGNVCEIPLPEGLDTTNMLRVETSSDIHYSWATGVTTYCGTCGDQEIFTRGICGSITEVNEEVKAEAMERMADNQDLYSYEENYMTSWDTRRSWQITETTTDDGRDICILLSTENYIDHDMLFIFIIKTALIALAAALLLAFLLTEWAYRKYLVNREMFEYRRGLTNIMAHDLKSPLMVISGYAENLAAGSNPEKNSFYTTEILKSVGTINGIIDSTLELAKTEDVTSIRREKVDLAECTGAILKDFAAVTEEKHITFETTGSGSIQADRAMVTTLLRNLCENAIKYSPEGGMVSITITPTSYTMTNPTASPITKTAEELLKPFTKGDNARTGQTGSGMGLAIAKSICDANAIRIHLDITEGQFTVKMTF